MPNKEKYQENDPDLAAALNFEDTATWIFSKAIINALVFDSIRLFFTASNFFCAFSIA